MVTIISVGGAFFLPKFNIKKHIIDKFFHQVWQQVRYHFRQWPSVQRVYIFGFDTYKGCYFHRHCNLFKCKLYWFYLFSCLKKNTWLRVNLVKYLWPMAWNICLWSSNSKKLLKLAFDAVDFLHCQEIVILMFYIGLNLNLIFKILKYCWNCEGFGKQNLNVN